MQFTTALSKEEASFLFANLCFVVVIDDIKSSRVVMNSFEQAIGLFNEFYQYDGLIFFAFKAKKYQSISTTSTNSWTTTDDINQGSGVLLQLTTTKIKVELLAALLQVQNCEERIKLPCAHSKQPVLYSWLEPVNIDKFKCSVQNIGRST